MEGGSRLTCIHPKVSNKVSAGVEPQDKTDGGKKRSRDIHGQDGDLELRDAIKVNCFAGRGRHETDF